MSTFPLIRTKWSNEHTMAILFMTLILYHIPVWRENPVGIIYFLLLVVVGLFIDSIASMLRYKKLWCCVSAAVTAAMISLLTQDIPLWGQLLGVAVALLLGKHALGGTGKNLLNPAMVGLLFLFIAFGIPEEFFLPTYLLLPAILLSLIFLKDRPFAGLGFILGMILALFLIKDLTILNLISQGVFFWGCLVMTDPVTVTDHPIAGAAAGFLVGFAALFYFSTPNAIVIGILAVNLFSAAIQTIMGKSPQVLKPKLKIPKAVSYNYSMQFIDLTAKKDFTMEEEMKIASLTAEEILQRLKEHEVYGMGGAAFSTYQKLKTIIESTDNRKELIINGVECDPGLVHDHLILRNYPSEIQKGIDLLCKCVNFQSVHLAVKDLEELNYAIKLRIHKVPDSYPIGAEKILIKKLLNRKLEHNQIPAENGILVLNMQTVFAIYQAVYLNNKVDTRFLTVANLKEKTAQVVRVSLGMKLKDVMEVVYPGIVNVFAGGGIMQAYLSEENAVIDKTINFIATGNIPNYKESPQCSKCGRCSKNCPSGLKVNLIADLVDLGKIKETAKYRVQECIGCGSCSYSCPAGRNLDARVKIAKNEMK